MRKTLIVLVTSLALILTVGVVSGFVGRRTMQELQSQVRSISEDMEQGAWERAVTKATALEALWEEKSRIVQLWVVHEDADEVTVEMGLVRVAAEQQDRVLGQVFCEELMQSIGHLYHRDAPSVKNIF